jgi:L-ascorbate metabolism protein UlaG (beta-lactamase superfamily)
MTSAGGIITKELIRSSPEPAHMRRSFLFLPLLFIFAGPAPAQEVKIAWFGQSMFEIVSSKGVRIVLDPQNLEEYRIKPIKADLVLMSHFHTDHTATDVIENIKEAKQYNALKKSGPGGAVQDWNDVDEKFKDVHFQSMGTYHDSMSGLKNGKNGVWIIDVDGLRIVHLGDLGHSLNKAQLKKLGTVDVLMVPVGGVYTLNGIEAFGVIEQIKPRRYVLPMHYGTPIYQDLLTLKYFTDECKENEVPIVSFKLKEWLKVDSKAPAPKRYSVAVLHWTGPPDEVKVKPKKK